MRQDPDVILVGEMRDVETVRAALSAAETGHLVMSTLHTIDAAETINRIIDFFPPHEQKQVRIALAQALRGIVSQRLVRLADGAGRRPAIEVMVNTGRTRRGDPRPGGRPAADRPHQRGRLLQDADVRPAPVPARPRRRHHATTRRARSPRNPHDLTVELRAAGLVA